MDDFGVDVLVEVIDPDSYYFGHVGKITAIYPKSHAEFDVYIYRACNTTFFRRDQVVVHNAG